MNQDPVSEKVYSNSGNPEVLKNVPEGASLVILDVGCGAGDNAAALHARGHTVDGITLSEEEAIKAGPVCRNIVVHNLEKGLPDAFREERYDCIVCSHVLEHICFPETVLAHMREVLKPGGRVVIALPNLLFARNRWNLLRGRFDYESSGLMDNTHFRWYTYRTAELLLKRMEVATAEHYVTGHLPVGGLRRHAPKTFGTIDRWLCRTWPGLFGYQLILVGEMAPNRNF